MVFQKKYQSYLFSLKSALKVILSLNFWCIYNSRLSLQHANMFACTNEFHYNIPILQIDPFLLFYIYLLHNFLIRFFNLYLQFKFCHPSLPF